MFHRSIRYRLISDHIKLLKIFFKLFMQNWKLLVLKSFRSYINRLTDKEKYTNLIMAWIKLFTSELYLSILTLLNINEAI